MKTPFERSILAGIGLLSMTHEKAQTMVSELSRRGEVEKSDVKGWAEQLVNRGEEERQAFRTLIYDEVKSVLDELGLATKDDIQKLVVRRKTQDK